VYADELSQRAIMAGIRAGHVFIDVDGTRDRILEVSASSGGRTARMGDALRVADGTAQVSLHAVAAAGGRWRVVEDGKALDGVLAEPISAADARASLRVPVTPGRHWLRVEVRSADGRRTWLIGNPVYLEG
jgi:hypothetical protein